MEMCEPTNLDEYSFRFRYFFSMLIDETKRTKRSKVWFVSFRFVGGQLGFETMKVGVSSRVGCLVRADRKKTRVRF